MARLNSQILEIDTTIHADTIVSHEPDSQAILSPFYPSDSLVAQNRIAELHNNLGKQNNRHFWFFLLFSVAVALLILNTKSTFENVVRSLFNFQYAMQFNRSERQGVFMVYMMYLFTFAIGFAYIFSYKSLFQSGVVSLLPFYSYFLLVASFFILDYIFSFFYSLFARHSKIVEMVHAVSFSYSIPYLLVCFTFLPFIFFGSFWVQQISYALFLLVVFVLFLLKEFRILRTISAEKVRVASFYFFAYLCSFKILPALILLKLIW